MIRQQRGVCSRASSLNSNTRGNPNPNPNPQVEARGSVTTAVLHGDKGPCCCSTKHSTIHRTATSAPAADE
jgi:hypothetical protein